MRATSWIAIVASLALIATPLLARSADAPSPIEGRWIAPDAVIVIAPCPDRIGQLCGTVTSHEYIREAVGLVVLDGFVGGPQEWRGRSYDGERHYAATAKVMAEKLSLRSCLAASLCETETWRRARR